MNRVLLEEYLRLIRNQVIACEQRISQQKQLIREMSPDTPATIGAKEYLTALEIAHALNVAHRDLIEKELATANPEWADRPS